MFWLHYCLYISFNKRHILYQQININIATDAHSLFFCFEYVYIQYQHQLPRENPNETWSRGGRDLHYNTHLPSCWFGPPCEHCCLLGRPFSNCFSMSHRRVLILDYYNVLPPSLLERRLNSITVQKKYSFLLEELGEKNPLYASVLFSSWFNILLLTHSIASSEENSILLLLDDRSLDTSRRLNKCIAITVAIRWSNTSGKH